MLGTIHAKLGTLCTKELQHNFNLESFSCPKIFDFYSLVTLINHSENHTTATTTNTSKEP